MSDHENFDPAEWERVTVNLRAIGQHIQSINALWAAATISLQRAWITDPVVARALRAEAPSGDGRSQSRDGASNG